MIAFQSQNISTLLKYLVEEYEVVGEISNRSVSNTASVFSGNTLSISFIGNDRRDGELIINESESGLIILPKTYKDYVLEHCSKKETIYVFVDSPRTNYARIINQTLKRENKDTEIHQTAVVDSGATIGENTCIGAFSHIEKASVGRNCNIGSHVHIMNEVIIGNNVSIQSGCIIGVEAMSPVMDEKTNLMEEFPQLGRVIIEDGVKIGANSCIHRGALDDTVIRGNARIDTFTQIAHGVDVGKDSFIVGHTHIGGSVKIGTNVFIGQSVSVANVGTIGNKAFIGIGSIVTQSVPDGVKVFGNPAKKIIEPKLSER